MTEVFFFFFGKVSFFFFSRYFFPPILADMIYHDISIKPTSFADSKALRALEEPFVWRGSAFALFLLGWSGVFFFWFVLFGWFGRVGG